MTDDALAIPEFSPGTRLFARFTLIRPLGAGTLSVVWLVRDDSNSSEIALKLLPPLLATDLALVEDLHRERDRNRAGVHAAVAGLYDIVWDDTLLGVLCEYIDGETIAERRAKFPGGIIPLAQLQGWTQQLCAVLESLHASGRVHGDLHPGCLMIDRRGRLRLLDFGIARPLAESVRLAAMRSRYGALAYQSPQRGEGGPVLRADDLYAVGATLRDLLSGQPPGLERGASPESVSAARAKIGVTDEPIPDEWESAIAACLAENPEARPGSARELATRLGLSIGPVSLNAPAPDPEPRPIENRRRKPRRARATRFTWLLFWLAAFGSLTAVSRLVWLLTAPREKTPVTHPEPQPPSLRGGPGMRDVPTIELAEKRSTPVENFSGGRQPDELSREELRRIGRRVWQNECAGTIDGLTSWNKGENFASMGIGHFIWYPEGVTGPFKESFPLLLDYLKEQQTTEKIPIWAAGACPWPNREAFMAAFHSAEMNDLRELLKNTVDLQARFLAHRLARAIAELDALPPSDLAVVRRRYRTLAASEAGMFAMIDYVNFKGEGTSPKERYQGVGWGLVQVILAMQDRGKPVADFAAAAAAVLETRVKNSPPERHEEKWLPGWKSRVRSYGE